MQRSRKARRFEGLGDESTRSWEKSCPSHLWQRKRNDRGEQKGKMGAAGFKCKSKRFCRVLHREIKGLQRDEVSKNRGLRRGRPKKKDFAPRNSDRGTLISLDEKKGTTRSLIRGGKKQRAYEREEKKRSEKRNPKRLWKRKKSGLSARHVCPYQDS